MKNKGRKTKQNHTHTTPSQPSTNNKQIKELKTNQKNLCPRKMDFAASIVVCLVFLGYPLITAGTSLPGLLPGFLGASHGCAEGTAWRLLPSASPTTTASSPVRGHSGEEGWDFGPFSAGSGGCHHIEMIWEYKGGRELWERDLPPTTLVAAAAAAGGGWGGVGGRVGCTCLLAQPRVVGVGTMEGIVNDRMSPSLRHYNHHYCVLFPSA